MIKINVENKHIGFLHIETQQPLDQKSTMEIKCDENYPTLVTQKSFYVSIYANILYVCQRVVQRYGGGSGCLDSTRISPAWSPIRPVRPPIFWYVWRLSSGRRQDMAIRGSTKGSHGCTKVWDGISRGRYVDDIWQICGPRCGTYMEDASTSNWIKSSSRTEIFF